MNKKSTLQLTTNFIVMLIIAIVVFSFSIYIVKKFFTHAETIRMTYDERTEKEIERLLDDGSRIAIPFDKKVIYNGEFKAFGIGILNVLNTGNKNDFKIRINFQKAYRKDNSLVCDTDPAGPPVSNCGEPDSWLKSIKDHAGPIEFTETIKNNEQEKFLLGVEPKNAPSGTYIFNVTICYQDDDPTNDENPLGTPTPPCNDIGTETDKFPDLYDTLRKLYVEVP